MESPQSIFENPSIEDFLATVDVLAPFIVPILIEAYALKPRRPPYSPLGMLKSILYRTRTESLRQLTRELRSNPNLRLELGLSRAPTHQAFSFFINRIGPERLQQISERVIAELRRYWPDFGAILSVDGTVVKAYAKRNRGFLSSTDPDARLGYKEHSAGKPQFEFGYRFTIGTEARYEVPITGVTTPANTNENKAFPAILKRVKSLGLPLDVVTADAQYDSRRNIWLTIGYGAKPVIALNPRSSKSVQQTGTRRADAILPIRRNSPEFKRYLAMRSASERVNSALKDHVGLKTLKSRRLSRVATFFWICVLTKQLFALSAARLRRDDLSRSHLVWCYK
jgi:transposase